MYIVIIISAIASIIAAICETYFEIKETMFYLLLGVFTGVIATPFLMYPATPAIDATSTGVLPYFPLATSTVVGNIIESSTATQQDLYQLKLRMDALDGGKATAWACPIFTYEVSSTTFEYAYTTQTTTITYGRVTPEQEGFANCVKTSP